MKRGEAGTPTKSKNRLDDKCHSRGLIVQSLTQFFTRLEAVSLPYFSTDEKNTAEPSELETRTAVLSQVYNYNRRFSGEPRTLMEQLVDLPVLLNHLWTYFWSGEGHFAFQLRIVLLGIMWLVIGLLDDFFIFLIIVMHLAYFFRQIFSNMLDGDIPGVNQ